MRGASATAAMAAACALPPASHGACGAVDFPLPLSTLKPPVCPRAVLWLATEELPMLKLKDFPPTDAFKAVMARHHDDFVGMLNRCLISF